MNHRWQIRQPAVLSKLRSSAQGMLRLLSATTAKSNRKLNRPTKGAHIIQWGSSVKWADLRTYGKDSRRSSVRWVILRTEGIIWWGPSVKWEDLQTGESRNPESTNPESGFPEYQIQQSRTHQSQNPGIQQSEVHQSQSLELSNPKSCNPRIQFQELI